MGMLTQMGKNNKASTLHEELQATDECQESRKRLPQKRAHQVITEYLSVSPENNDIMHTDKVVSMHLVIISLSLSHIIEVYHNN